METLGEEPVAVEEPKQVIQDPEIKMVEMEKIIV